MKIYNTVSKKKEELKTIKPNEVKIYICGPTVYNYIHIGNARPMCVFDVLRRYLEYKGYKVLFVQNFTDIDDKIIKRAKEENVNFLEISEKFIKEYKIDAKGLNIKKPTYEPRATENIDYMIKIISKLISKGFAYQKNNDVFFRVKNYSDYGFLSHINMEDLEAGARIEVNDKKEDPLDFVLWKAAKDGEPFWESPWGKGRPGWHIECTAMINRILGDTIDIHCGGQDLIFPHHENEIAQSVCFTNLPYANYWMHNGYITIDNKKMSKSLGNFFNVREVANKFGYPAIRFMMLQVHYRNPINYSLEILKQSASSLERISNCKNSLEYLLKHNVDNNIGMENKQKQSIINLKSKFINAMDDDLNTADAISVIFELVTEINVNIINKQRVSKEYLLFAKSVFDELTNVLGLLYNNEELETDEEFLNEEIKKLIMLRDQARKNKNFIEADKIRNEIVSKGFILEDTPNGAVVKKKKL